MIKRSFDIFVSLIALLIMSPIILVLCLLVYLNMGAPIVFSQQRPGKGTKPFNMIKFRTMKNSYDGAGNLLPDEQRITKFGAFLRSSSLDELPELWNVLSGDMSLVGPRPLLMEYLPLYSIEQSRRHEVSPGVTGWAQINGRNAISWEQKFELDIWYVDNQGFWLDIKILCLTLFKVFKREGINAPDSVTMEKFKGSQ